MTTLDILFRYSGQPTESAVLALASAREVYGIFGLKFNRDAKTVLVGYDATRLNSGAVARLLRQAGLQIEEELPLIPSQPEPAPTA